MFNLTFYAMPLFFRHQKDSGSWSIHKGENFFNENCILRLLILCQVDIIEQKWGVISTSTEPDIFRMLFSIKNKKVWCCKPPAPLVGQKICSLHEILTWLVITVNGWQWLFSDNQPCQYFMQRTGFWANQRYRRFTTP